MQIHEALMFSVCASLLVFTIIQAIRYWFIILRLRRSIKILCHELGNCVDMKTRLEWNQHKAILCNDGKRRSINYVTEVMNERI